MKVCHVCFHKFEMKDIAFEGVGFDDIPWRICVGCEKDTEVLFVRKVDSKGLTTDSE